MQTRSPRELMAYRMAGGATKGEAYGVEVRRARGANPYNNMTQKFFHDAPSIFRQNDEPGVWRWFHNAEPIPLDQLKDLFAGDPALEAELRERRMLEDRQTALNVLAGVVNGNGAKPVEQRGAYALVETGGGLFQVTCSGIQLLPGPCGESVARSVLDAVAAPIVAPPEASLAQELGA